MFSIVRFEPSSAMVIGVLEDSRMPTGRRPVRGGTA
jgi:hypothetical protein